MESRNGKLGLSFTAGKFNTSTAVAALGTGTVASCIASRGGSTCKKEDGSWLVWGHCGYSEPGLGHTGWRLRHATTSLAETHLFR
jgi:hypothetical protein